MFFYCCLILFYLFLFLLVSINQLVSNFNRTLDNEGNLRAELAGTRLITANQRRELVEQVRVQPGEGHEWVVICMHACGVLEEIIQLTESCSFEQVSLIYSIFISLRLQKRRVEDFVATTTQMREDIRMAHMKSDHEVLACMPNLPYACTL